MVEVIVFSEGQTEEQFIKRVVAPALRHLSIFIKPQLLTTSRDSRGGDVSLSRLKINARNTLRQQPRAILTTLLDLYGLNTDFPAYAQAMQQQDVYQRCDMLQSALHMEIVDYVECRPERFIAHIQPYEFEGLLFSDVTALANTEPQWSRYLPQLQQVRESFPTPEHINGSYETKPSKRLDDILTPNYHKTRHGPLAAEHVTLARMEYECVHFAAWLEKLRSLKP
nr:DUF4276 family protein [uncultured Pseudomonas sp.]